MDSTSTIRCELPKIRFVQHFQPAHFSHFTSSNRISPCVASSHAAPYSKHPSAPAPGRRHERHVDMATNHHESPRILKKHHKDLRKCEKYWKVLLKVSKSYNTLNTLIWFSSWEPRFRAVPSQFSWRRSCQGHWDDIRMTFGWHQSQTWTHSMYHQYNVHRYIYIYTSMYRWRYVYIYIYIHIYYMNIYICIYIYKIYIYI